jgi:anti-sigma regulatory factor (Ser/Thr protein kinase)
MSTDFGPLRHDSAVADAGLLLDIVFTEAELVGLRQAVAAQADAAGLNTQQMDALVFIAYELATNAVRHGGGKGRLRLRQRTDAILCQVTDDGPGITPGAAARSMPDVGAAKGRGLWLVKSFADSLTYRSADGEANGADVVAAIRLTVPEPD